MALRLAIGWHFFQEGNSKLNVGKFSSVGFLSSAKGPLSGAYHALLKDPDGLERLNYNPTAEGLNKIELQQTLGVWDVHREQMIGYYGFDDNQKRQAGRVFEQKKQELLYFFAIHADDINEYFLQLQRIKDNAADPAKNDVPTLYGQATDLAGEQAAARNGWLRQIDQMWVNYDKQLAGLATKEQRAQRGNDGPGLPLPGSVGSMLTSVVVDPSDGKTRISMSSRLKVLDTDVVNGIIPYFDLTVGVLLMLGLFTRTAASFGGLFLLSVVVSQWPGSAGAAPIYYQSIELMSLFVLAAVGAGRIGGLDYFVSNWRRLFGANAKKKSE